MIVLPFSQTARSPEDLVNVDILPAITPELRRVAEEFSVAVTPAMVNLIDRDDPHDPIAAQFIPSAAELNILPGERPDPIDDDAFSPVEGVVHRYPDRVLLKLLRTCAVYCRFCFRREQVGEAKAMLSGEAIDRALDYIRAHTEIWEVILSGGDPLVLSDRRLGDVIEKLNAISHVKVVRIHTRLPVVDPERITPDLIAALRGRAPVYVLLHCNHPRELTPEARAACALLVDAGFPMLSQSVLLRGVNDDAAVLAELMRAFVACRITPHYLHHGDLARGTSHFRVSVERGQELVRGLRGHLSGLCQPSYMLDIPGGHGKVPISSGFIQREGDVWSVEDYRGKRHIYCDANADSPASLPSENETCEKSQAPARAPS